MRRRTQVCALGTDGRGMNRVRAPWVLLWLAVTMVLAVIRGAWEKFDLVAG